MNTVVVGVGNPILGDDGIGIHIVKELKGRSDVDIREAYTGGLNLLDLLIGYERAILVDAVYIQEMNVGEVRTFSIEDLESAHSSNPHDASLMDAIESARRMGEKRIPKEISIVAIRIDRVNEFSDTLSPGLMRSIPIAVEKINELIR